LLYERNGRKHWDFSKGHRELGESPQEAVRREIKEETGLTQLDFASGFEEKIHFMFRNAGELVSKDATFFIARTSEEKLTLSSEHADIQWLSYEEALERLTFKNSKDVLQKAHVFITSGKTTFQQTLM
jgi:8-oxo-dGTP pyrophosphatase MutT (NUDIX family)